MKRVTFTLTAGLLRAPSLLQAADPLHNKSRIRGHYPGVLPSASSALNRSHNNSRRSKPSPGRSPRAARSLSWKMNR